MNNRQADRGLYSLQGIKATKSSPNPYLYQALAFMATELRYTEEARQWYMEGTKTLLVGFLHYPAATVHQTASHNQLPCLHRILYCLVTVLLDSCSCIAGQCVILLLHVLRPRFLLTLRAYLPMVVSLGHCAQHP